MEYYRIAGIDFGLSKQALTRQRESIAINERTWRALKLLLDSNRETVSKDLFVEDVWQGVIVSDASVFKQVQVVRNLFAQMGLQDDLIENVYGQGYRLTLAVNTIKAPKTQVKKTSWTVAALLVLFALVAMVAHQTQPEVDVLDKAQRKNILTLMQEDWQEGLMHVDALLQQAQAYSASDLAYLYHQKGQAHLNLQQFTESREALVKSMAEYRGLRDWLHQGDVAMQMARLYDYLDDNEVQLSHINDSIHYFKKAGAKTKLVDAMLEKASFQRKLKDFPAAKQAYQDALESAEQIDDQVGQMMAINNLAATHLLLNENQKAVALGEQGLALSLKGGNGQHIANSYSFLSQLYWQQNQQKQALNMMSQALTYQIETKSHKHLSPKLMNLNYLLLETGQFSAADRLLSVTESYAAALHVKTGSAVVALYQGMNHAHQSEWQQAHQSLEKSYQIAIKNDIAYKKPTIMGYLSMSRVQNGQFLKAIELASQTLAEAQLGEREKLLAQLALVQGYDATEQTALAQQVLSEISVPEDWIFGQIIHAKITRQRTEPSAIEFRHQQQQHIDTLYQQWSELAAESAFDDALLSRLVEQVNGLVEQLNS